jgi:hypothetical protein
VKPPTVDTIGDYLDRCSLASDEAANVTAFALIGIRHDLAAIVTELRELRYAMERAR